MFKRYIITLLLTTTFIACKRKLNHSGVYHIYKEINGKNTDPQADEKLKQRYLNKSFAMMFGARVLDLSNTADPKPIVLQRLNGRDGTVNYTPGGYDPFYHDASVFRMELLTTPSDTILFIQDKFFLSAQSVSSGKQGGMIICYLTKKNR